MKKNNKKPDLAHFRQEAERLMKTRPLKMSSSSSETDMLKIIHELHVHKIELEMMNKELMHVNTIH